VSAKPVTIRSTKESRLISLAPKTSGFDIRELQKAGVPAVSLRQDGLDYFDTHHTADDTLDKIDPKQLDQAVAVWSAFTHLAAASDVDFRRLAPTSK
jgi:carboxypeptidase Q